AVVRWPGFVRAEQAAADIGVVARQQGDRHARVFLLCDRGTQDRGIEPNRAVEVRDRDVHPDDLIRHRRLLGMCEVWARRTDYPKTAEPCQPRWREGCVKAVLTFRVKNQPFLTRSVRPTFGS